MVTLVFEEFGQSRWPEGLAVNRSHLQPLGSYTLEEATSLQKM